MAESIFSTFAISGEGLTVQRMRLAAVARNIANVNTTKAEGEAPYKREITVVSAKQGASFGDELNQQLQLSSSDQSHSSNAKQTTDIGSMSGLEIETKFDSTTRLVYEPSHPHADKDGYVKMPNINIVTEMVEMISAQKAFEANTTVIESAKNIARDSLEI